MHVSLLQSLPTHQVHSKHFPTGNGSFLLVLQTPSPRHCEAFTGDPAKPLSLICALRRAFRAQNACLSHLLQTGIGSPRAHARRSVMSTLLLGRLGPHTCVVDSITAQRKALHWCACCPAPYKDAGDGNFSTVIPG